MKIGVVVSTLLLLTCSQPATSADSHSERLGVEFIKHVQAHTRMVKPAGGYADAKVRAMAKGKQAIAGSAADNYYDLADQCQSVLGEIPAFHCTEDGQIVPKTQDGKLMTYVDGRYYLDGVSANSRVKNECDKPKLAPADNTRLPPDVYCRLNNRIGRVTRGNVDWVFHCQNTTARNDDADTWEFFNVIGANRETGESCFLFYRSRLMGSSNREPLGRMYPPVRGGPSAERWDDNAASPSRTNCSKCHYNNKPWSVTNELLDMKNEDDERIVPTIVYEKRMTPGWGFRVIGTVPTRYWSRPKLVFPKLGDGTADRTCSTCHLLQAGENFRYWVHQAADYYDSDYGGLLDPRIQRKPEAWMPPGSHKGLYDRATVIAAVDRYEDAMFGDTSEHIDPTTPCPAPVDIASEDVTGVVEDGQVTLALRYKILYGGVPERDDVRMRIEVSVDGRSSTFEDVAPDELGSENWHFRHSYTAGKTYRYTITPYRYCFDDAEYQDAENTLELSSEDF